MRGLGVLSRLIVLSSLLAAIAYLALHRDLLDPALLEKELKHFGRLAPICFVLIYAVGTVLFAPGSILTIVGGALFGPSGECFGAFRVRPWGRLYPF
jgi:uncharacterized membrane protein YdjX (TVP38/TMEM64 family)